MAVAIAVMLQWPMTMEVAVTAVDMAVATAVK